MQVEIAAKAGFCFGVSRAVDAVYRQVEVGSRPVCTYGPIIHNESVTQDLAARGVRVIHSTEETKKLRGGTVVLRSHGVSREVEDALRGTGLSVVDATCPFVQKIHSIVDSHARNGYFIVIAGSADHPEVEGIVGWIQNSKYRVVASVPEACALDLRVHKKVCLVAQTTFNHKKFQDIVEIFRKKGYDSTNKVGNDEDFLVCDTICSATRERQEAARRLSRRMDAMIVIGGASSSNTRKLYEICSEECQNTCCIQTREDLSRADFSCCGCVGITAGASTPRNIIEEVQKYVRREF